MANFILGHLVFSHNVKQTIPGISLEYTENPYPTTIPLIPAVVYQMFYFGGMDDINTTKTNE